MGGWISWCCVGGDADDELTRLKGGGTLDANHHISIENPAETFHGVHAHAINGGSQHLKSKPQAITLCGPMFADGTLESKYEIVTDIGHGSTSIVYRCRERETGRAFACKIIDKRSICDNKNELLDQFRVEVQILQSLRHPNIIHVQDVYQTDAKICLVTELMQGGELFDYIIEKGTLSEVEASGFVRKITSAVAYMHDCGIVHRDLKPENLMLTTKSPDAEVKLIDFGLAKILDDQQATSFLGTRGYLAPEMVRGQEYSMAVDMWALGVIVYVLVCGCMPFNDDGSKLTNDNVARQKYRLRFPRWANGLSESARDLLRHLLEYDATKRYTAHQALRHPWVTGQQTPNRFLRSPNYLGRIRREERNLEVAASRVHEITTRRQSR